MVVLFLVPYLGLSGALQPLTPIIATQLHASEQTIGIGYGLANAGYAVGTVLAVQLAQHLPQRRLMVVYAALLVIGSVLAATATGAPVFIVGHVLQGLCTSLLLIASTPPLILGYPVGKLRSTAVIFNLCIFGAVAAGPLIGGAQASFHAWRPLFWIVAGIAFLGLVMSLLTFSDAPPADLSAPRDPVAIGLAATGSVAAFFGAAELLTHGFLDPVAVIPLLVGVALIAALIVYEYRARHPLLILRNLVSTIPMTGVVVAICAAAAATSAIALTATVQAPHYTPLHLGLLYIPELAAAVLTAIVFGAVFSTRFIHYYALTGMVILAAGVLVLRSVIPPGSALTLAGSALVGIGIGASVVPALFLAGYSLRSASIQRVFAILELLRAIAAFLIAPILLHFAVTVTGLPSAAMNTALWICFGLSAGGAVVGVLLYVLGRVRPAAPALERWMGGMEPAWESPPLLAALRPGAPLPTLAAAAAAAALSGGGRLVTASAGLPGLPAFPGGTRCASRRRLGRCCSPTTARGWPRRRSPRPAASCPPGATRSCSPSGGRSTSASSRNPGPSSTRRAPTRSGRPPSRPPPTVPRWPRRPDSRRSRWRCRGRPPPRRSPTPPTITTPASSSSAPTARPGSAAGWREASPPRSPPARSGRS